MKRKKIREDSISGRSVTLTFPMPPNLANGRMHWRTKHKAKLAYWEYLDLLCFTGRLPRWILPPMRVVSLASAMVLGRSMDDDNAVSRHKWLIDWLRARCFILADDRKALRWSAFPTQRISRKEEPSITLTLTEVGAFKDTVPIRVEL